MTRDGRVTAAQWRQFGKLIVHHVSLLHPLAVFAAPCNIRAVWAGGGENRMVFMFMVGVLDASLLLQVVQVCVTRL